jgi:putative MATE family efflux protein|tara:strand:+ start:3252 stop:4670 length:1419 start_codon:yes stop_codon:yes gene_type:complete
MFKFIFPQDKAISKEVLNLAFPVILSNLSRVLMSMFDVAMVGRLGAEALAATGMGAMLLWGALSLVLGIRTAVQTVASRRLGQKIDHEAGTAFHNGLIMATIYALPVSLAGWLWAKDILPFFIDDATATPLAVDYASIVFISLLFSAYSFVFQGFFTGVEKTKIHMAVTVTSNILNVYLNAGLIYGTEGVTRFFSETIPHLSFFSIFWQWMEFPALGVKGAAIATLIASTWMTLHYFTFLFSKQIKNRFAVFTLSADRSMMKRQLKLAVPQGVQEAVIAVGWSVFYKIMGMIGLIELATTELLFTIMHASFMPALGVGQACSTLVSKYMGEKKIHKSETSIKESIRLAEYIMGVMGLSFILFPKFYLFLFTNDPEIIRMGVFGLRMIGAVQFLDAIGFVLWFALSGAGNTLFPAMVESCLTWGVIVLGSYVFGVVLEIGFAAPWMLFPVYMGLFAGIMVWKILQGDWKEIEV